MSWIGMAAAKSAIRSISPRSAAAFQQPIDQRFDPRLQRAQRARRKGRRQQLSHPRVIGRIVEHQACRVMLVEQAVGEIRPEVELLVGTPSRGVAIDRETIVIAGQEIRPVRHAMNRIELRAARDRSDRDRRGSPRSASDVESHRGSATRRQSCGIVSFRSHSLRALRTVLALDQRTGRIGRAERLLARDMREDLVVVPRIFRTLPASSPAPGRGRAPSVRPRAGGRCGRRNPRPAFRASWPPP